MSLIASGPAAPSPARPWPADRVEHWPIERLIPYANNPRLHSEADLDKIGASILRWGWTNPALVDENGVLIAGHGRVGAAVKVQRAGKLQVTSIPVIVARGWSEDSFCGTSEGNARGIFHAPGGSRARASACGRRGSR